MSSSLPSAFHFLLGQQLHLQMQELFPKGKPGSIFEVGSSSLNHPFLPLSCLRVSVFGMKTLPVWSEVNVLNDYK